MLKFYVEFSDIEEFFFKSLFRLRKKNCSDEIIHAHACIKSDLVTFVTLEFFGRDEMESA